MLQDLIGQFGYPALVLGTFLEGEVSLLLAAYMAVRNVLEIEWVALCAFLGTFASDQLWYYLGRRHGRALLARKPRWQPLGDRASALIQHYPDLWVLCFRFLYGLRTVMPLTIGLSGYSWRRYPAARRHRCRRLGRWYQPAGLQPGQRHGRPARRTAQLSGHPARGRGAAACPRLAKPVASAPARLSREPARYPTG
jgi:membrane protein YqaA with SNARE-associated domain